MQPLVVDNLPAQGAGYHISRYQKDGFHLPWHMHESYELTLIQRGSGQRIVGSHIAPFEPGDTVLLAPNLPHAWKNSRHDKPAGVRAITLKLDEQHPLTGLLELPDMLPLRRVLEASRRGLQLVGSLRDQVADKLETLSVQPDYRQLAGILDILATISESTQTHSLLPGNTPAYPARESTSTRKVIDYIFEHYTETLDANRLSSIAEIHPSSLGRSFKRTTGFTPTEFINQVRINRACQLLNQTELPVLEISLACGYENLSWFNRVFRQLRGCTPSTYRDQFSEPTPTNIRFAG